ncbi:MAG: extracellular solute-binding protein [Albidovulum sp.]
MKKELILNRRQLMTGAAAAALGVAVSPRMSFAEGNAAVLDAFKAADIDWQAFKGETLTIGAMTHPWSAAIEPALPTFTELTGIEVKMTTQSETEYVSEMPIKLGAKSAEPDVMMIHSLGQFVAAGWAAPLDEFYADKALFDAAWYEADDMFAMARDFPAQPDGQNYSMSITAEAQTLFANKAMFDEAGLAIPKTMDDLIAAALKLKTDAHAGIVMRAKSDGSAGPWPCGGFVFSYGGAIIDPASGKCVLDSDAAVAAVEMYGRLLREGGPLGVGNYHWYEVLNDFSTGAAAMGCDSSNFATDISNPEKSLVAADAVYAALPKAGDNPIKANIWAWQAGINANSAKKKAAFLLLSFLNSKPGCLLSSANGLATVRNSAWQSEAFQTRFGAQAATAALENLNSGDATVFKAAWFHPKSSEILDPFAVAINQVATGQAEAKAALTEARQKIDKAIGG